MLRSTLATFCLIMSNLPWFMHLTCQVPVQDCSLQYWTLFSLPDTSTTGRHCCFGSASSFFPELLLCSTPVVYWTPTDLGGSSFSAIPFCIFTLLMGFSRQKYSSASPFPSPVALVLSDPAQQGHALQLLHVARGHAWCPGCPTWVCKPASVTGCWSTCCLGPGQRPCWSFWSWSMLEDAQEWTVPGLSPAAGCPKLIT